MILILLFSFILVSETSFNVINDQTRYSEEFFWNESFVSYGVASKLTPLGSKYYIFTDPSKKIEYFLASGTDLETNTIFYFVYLEIPISENNLKIHVLYQQDEIWNQFEFLFDKLQFEGIWHQQQLYYDDINQLVIVEIRYGQNTIIKKSFTYTNLINKNFIFTIGGIFNEGHPITNEPWFLQTFPGRLEGAIASSNQDFEYGWIHFNENQCSEMINLQMERLDFQHPEQHQIYMIEQKNLFYYKVTLWCIISNIGYFDSNQEMNIIRIAANRFTTNFQQTGSNSFVLKYNYDSQQEKWIMNIEYYSYTTPIILKFENNDDPFKIQDQILLDKEYFSSWHFISIEYNGFKQINFYFENVLQEFTVSRIYQNVNQFSQIYYRLFLGGSPQERNSLPRSFALISYYDCLQQELKCHFSCKTCYGPLITQCLSCDDNSNRIYDTEQQTCKCKIWYTENMNHQCAFSSKDGVELSLKQSDDNEQNQFDEFCQFGEFSYQNQCFNCPSAKQITSVICSECLMRPIDWIQKSSQCIQNYQLYNSSSNFNYVELQINNEVQNIQFLLQDEELITCDGCTLCQEFSDNCFYSNYYQHLNKDTYIRCLSGYTFEDGKCKKISLMFQNNPKCLKGCSKCTQNQCLICESQMKYFLNHFGQCQLCTILLCKQCFQYNIFEHSQNTIFRTETSNGEISDDFIIGCALCESGYYYSFKKQQCLKNLQNGVTKYYQNYNSDFQYYQTTYSALNDKYQEIISCNNLIQNCKNCVYNNLGLMVCIICSDGYFIDNRNGMCLKCSQFLYNAQTCFIESELLNSYKYQIMGFTQQFSQQYMNYIDFTSKSNKLIISKCQDQMIINKRLNQCSNSCLDCDQCLIVNDKSQCIKCTQFQKDENNFFSQKSGQCYECPYPCKFCLQLDSDIISKYNPYFLQSDETIGQARKCLVNFDDELTFINQKSGLTQPFDKTTQEKQYFFGESQIQINEISDGSFILQKSVSEFYFMFGSDMIAPIQLLNYFYPLKKLTLQIYQGEVQNYGDSIFYNATHFILEDLQYLESKYSSLQLISQFGIDVNINNVTIEKAISKKFLFISICNKLSIKEFNFKNITLLNSKIIEITQCNQDSLIVAQNMSFQNCIFNNASFLSINSQDSVIITVQNITFINCTFFNSKILYLNHQNANTKIIIQDLIFIDCKLQSSLVLFFPKSDIIASIFSVYIKDSKFQDSNFLLSQSSIQIENVIFDTLLLNESIIFCQTFDDNDQLFSISNFTSHKIQFYESNFISITPLQQSIYSTTKMKNLSFQNIIEIYSQGKIINNYLIFIQNSNIQINNINVTSNFVIQFLSALDSLCVNLQSFYISSINKNIEIPQELSNGQIFQNQLIYIQSFKTIYFDDITIDSLFQYVDPLIQIRADDTLNKNITISKVRIQFYQSTNIFKSLNSAFYIQLQSISNIMISESIFQDIIFYYTHPNTDLLFSSLIKIKAPQSKVIIFNSIFENITIFNSSETVILIEADYIELTNVFVQNINQIENYLQKSMCGFSILTGQYISIINSNFLHINSIYYGIAYIQLKQLGEFNIVNSIFDQDQRNFSTLSLPQFGGAISINAELSKLSLLLSNVTAKFLLTTQCCAFLYLIPSQIANIIQLENINLQSIFSTDFSLSEFNFQQTTSRNQVSLTNVFLNNSVEISNYEPFFLIKSQLFNSSNTVGLFSCQKCNLKLINYYFQGNLHSPLFYINDAYNVIINKVELSLIFVKDDLSYLIKIDGSLKGRIIFDSFNFHNLSTSSIIKSFINFNITQSLGVNIMNIQLNQIFCPNCLNGLILIQSKQGNQKIIFFNVNILDSICGDFSCIQFSNIQLIMKQNKFLSLMTEKLGILNFQNCQIILNKTIIKNCISNSIGGAIYANNSKLNLSNLILINNTAQIGGAIYLQQSKLSRDKIQHLQLFENSGKLGMSNIRENPDSLSLKMYNVKLNTKRRQSSKITIDSPSYFINNQQLRVEDNFIKLKSGQKLRQYQIFDRKIMQYSQNNISLQLEQFTQLGEKVIDTEEQKCFVSQKQINLTNFSEAEIQQFDISEQIFDNQAYIYFNETSQSYQLDNLVFYLDPYSDKNQKLIISIQCETLQSDYFFYFFAKTIPCEIGEYFNNDGINKECLICDYEKGYFSVEKKSLECQRQDQKKIQKVSQSSLELQPGYWRYSFYSHNIEECERFSSCLGGSKVNYNSCEIGYIGAICKECDLYNIRGDSQFMKQLNGDCKQIQQFQEIVILSIVLILFIFSLAITIACLKQKMSQSYRFLKFSSLHYKILFKCNLDEINTRIKLLIHFSQITYQLVYKLNLPINIQYILWPVARSQTILQFLAYYKAEEFTISILYLKAIWTQIIPVCEFTILSLIYATLQLKQRKVLNYQFFLFIFYFFLIYSMPSIIEELSYLIQKQTLGNIDWVGANISYQFNTNEHWGWMKTMIIPELLFCKIFMPIFILIILIKFKKRKTLDFTKGLYGYFCSDYKDQFYLWELFHFENIMLIIFLNSYIYDTLNVLKTLLILVILFVVYVITSVCKPYLKENLNKILTKCTFMICILISISCLLQRADQVNIQSLNFITQIILIALVCIIIGYNLLKLLNSIMQVNFELIDSIIDFLNIKFPFMSKSYPKIFKPKRELKENFKQKVVLLRNLFKAYKLHQKNQKYSFNQSGEETHLAITSNLRSEQRQLLLSFPQVQHSIIL